MLKLMHVILSVSQNQQMHKIINKYKIIYNPYIGFDK
jgi:hypothetical protein